MPSRKKNKGKGRSKKKQRESELRKLRKNILKTVSDGGEWTESDEELDDDWMPFESGEDECDSGDLPAEAPSRWKPPELSPQADAEIERWWKTYQSSKTPARLQQVRDKLVSVPSDDDRYHHLFPDAVYLLEEKLPRAKYVDFLEEVRKTRNDVFDLNADWNTRAMVFEYLAQDRLGDVDAAALSLAESLQEVSDPFFSLMTTLRLAGRATAAEALLDAAMRLLQKSKLMPWAVDELIEWAMFHAYQRGLAAGADDAAIEALHDAARKMDLTDSEEQRANRRDVLLHLSGQANKSWQKAELTSTTKAAYRNIYLLGFDFQRYLATECDVPPIAADELRSLVMEWINRVEQPLGGLLKGLVRREFEPVVARKLDFMSLDRIHAPATIIAASRFYDFLKRVDLVTLGAWQKSLAVCQELWDELRDVVKEEWASYEFLDRYRRFPDAGQ